ncbi:MAG: hypothetical protein D3M94_22300 [Rhodocyclales bacterium GT-UBC]|nr:MAG: hypothetical protein D3M94_22300 [Rhodocyclales bacterium GT-UBC]
MKKISAAILDYAKPVLDELPPDTSLETRREVIGFAILVWNALVMVEWGRPDFLADLKDRLATLEGADIVTGAFDRLVERKQQRHAHDDRAVGNWEMRVKHDGSLSLWAEARGR